MKSNKVKITKKEGLGYTVEINGVLIDGVSRVSVRNIYTPEETQEEVNISLIDISSLEITSN